MKANVRMDCVLLRGSAIRLVSFSLPLFGLPAYGMAQAVSGQRTFSKPSEGLQALVAAARSGDHAQLLAVLGSHAKDLIDSGDPVADKKALDHFVKLYAQKFASDPGKQNGLYWEVAAGKPQSPMGPAVAEAAAEGYGGGPQPYHGAQDRRKLPSSCAGRMRPHSRW